MIPFTPQIRTLQLIVVFIPIEPQLVRLVRVTNRSDQFLSFLEVEVWITSILKGLIHLWIITDHQDPLIT